MRNIARYNLYIQKEFFMTKKSILFTLLVAVPLLFASCSKKTDESKTVTESHAENETKTVSKNSNFAGKVYVGTSDFSTDVFFIDSSYFVKGLGCGNYTFDKKTNQLTITAIGVGETLTFNYDKETDTLTDTDGIVYKYERNCSEFEIENAKELIELMKNSF